MTQEFRNDDSVLLSRVDALLAQRKQLGLDGLVGGLETVLYGVDADRLEAAVADFLNTTGYFFGTALEGPELTA
jgi:hypothetical protein